MLYSVSEDPTECSGNSSGRDEDTNTLRLHLARVPQRKVISQTGKESSFSYSKEETSATEYEGQDR